jgi:hypothetical protein
LFLLRTGGLQYFGRLLEKKSMAIELADALVGALLMMALPYIISVGTAQIWLSMIVVIGLLIYRRQR